MVVIWWSVKLLLTQVGGISEKGLCGTKKDGSAKIDGSSMVHAFDVWRSPFLVFAKTLKSLRTWKQYPIPYKKRARTIKKKKTWRENSYPEASPPEPNVPRWINTISGWDCSDFMDQGPGKSLIACETSASITRPSNVHGCSDFFIPEKFVISSRPRCVIQDTFHPWDPCASTVSITAMKLLGFWGELIIAALIS